MTRCVSSTIHEIATGHLVSTAVVGGARARFYIRDVSRPLCSVGAQLHPGAADVLFGVHADELADRHTALEDLWGGRVSSMRDRLGRPPRWSSVSMRSRSCWPNVSRRSVLSIPRWRKRSTSWPPRRNIHHVVMQSGYSHRRFIELFSHAVGTDAEGLLPRAALPAGPSTTHAFPVSVGGRRCGCRGLQRSVPLQPRVSRIRRRHPDRLSRHLSHVRASRARESALIGRVKFVQDVPHGGSLTCLNLASGVRGGCNGCSGTVCVSLREEYSGGD